MDTRRPAGLFAGEQEMNPGARFALRPVDESINSEDVMINEAGGFERGSDGGQIGAPDQQIDVARRADGVLVDPADPFGDGIAAGDGVTDLGRLEGAGCPAQPLFDLFRCHERPFPTAVFDRRFCHDESSL